MCTYFAMEKYKQHCDLLAIVCINIKHIKMQICKSGKFKSVAVE